MISDLCKDRVCIVTGAGRGIGREHALMLAAHGAKVVVNDLGAAADGTGADQSPAQQVVDEIRAAGGEAVANGDDVSDFEAARRMIAQAVSSFGRLDVLVNNAGILRDRMLVNMTEAEWDAVIKVHLKGTFAPAHYAAAHWREEQKAGRPGRRAHHQHHVGLGHLRQPGPDQLRRRQDGHRRLHDHRGARAAPLRRHGERGRARARSRGSPSRSSRGELSEEQKAAMSPRWIAPIVTWLASRESREITGRVFEASGRVLAVAEGWHRGPTVAAVDDPLQIGSVVVDLVKRARKNAGMDGKDLD